MKYVKFCDADEINPVVHFLFSILLWNCWRQVLCENNVKLLLVQWRCWWSRRYVHWLWINRIRCTEWRDNTASFCSQVITGWWRPSLSTCWCSGSMLASSASLTTNVDNILFIIAGRSIGWFVDILMLFDLSSCLQSILYLFMQFLAVPNESVCCNETGLLAVLQKSRSKDVDSAGIYTVFRKKHPLSFFLYLPGKWKYSIDVKAKYSLLPVT